MNPTAAILILCQPAETGVTALTLRHLVRDLDPATTAHVLMNGGFTGELEAIGPRSWAISYYSSPTNLGVAGGRNLLLRRPEVQSSDVIVILDNDVITPPGHIERLISTLSADPDAGVIGAAVLDFRAVAGALGIDCEVDTAVTKEHLARLGRRLGVENAWFHLGTHPDWRAVYFDELPLERRLLQGAGARVEPFAAMNHQDPAIRAAVAEGSGTSIPAANVAGCCQVFRRDLLDEIGYLMDEFSPYGYEDVEFCIRAVEAGKRNYIDPRILMLHGTDRRHLERQTPAARIVTHRNLMRCKALLAWRHAGPTWQVVVERSILRRYLLDRQTGQHRTAAEHLRARRRHPRRAAANSTLGGPQQARAVTGFVPDFDAIPSVAVEDFDGSSLRAFKDCHRAERCFILGNGPSLLNTDLAPLADEITFGVNGIFFMTRQCGFAPTYYVVEDNHVFADDLGRIETVDAVARFFPSKYRAVIEPRPDTHFLPTDWSFYWGSSEWYETPRFSHDVSRVIYAGQTVTFLNLQLAVYMGCREIYLVGVDYDYKIPADAEIEGLTITSIDDDPNHFHPDYFGRGKRWHLPKLDNVGKAMLCAKAGVEEVGAAIFNATVGGKLEIFPRADYHEVVNRPVLAEPNAPHQYLLSRALDRAALLGLKTVAIDRLVEEAQVAAIVAASPLRSVDDDQPDVVVTRADVTEAVSPAGRPDDGRVVILLDEPVDEAGRAATAKWLSQLLIERLTNRRAAFWTRSVLELSADGDSVVIPALGRTAQRSVDPTREFGLDRLAQLDATRSTRWAYGRKLSIDRIEGLVADVVNHGHSVGVVDGYVYVQSPWKPIEPPVGLLSCRTSDEGGPDVGIRP